MWDGLKVKNEWPLSVLNESTLRLNPPAFTGKSSECNYHAFCLCV